MLTALRGALAFLTRLPVGGGERAWDAFRATPIALPLAGYAVGALVALPLALSPVLALPAPTAAAYLAALYLLTGITHADGLADCADAAAVHGRAARREVLDDPSVGVGGALALVVAVGALGLGALAAARAGPVVAVALAVAAEVGAKTGMAMLVCRGRPAHEGLGSAVVDGTGRIALLPVVLAALSAPALATAVDPSLTVAVGVTVVAGAAVALPLGAWASARLGGVSGDVLGATNELGRVVGLHAGVIAWTLS
ncbi:MAG: adenosylcobinamide-GDP ribazoletransferase [Haloferacaceae archaeon]